MPPPLIGPIDAAAVKTRLRRYTLAIPVATLIGGWCALLLLTWITYPAAVAQVPAFVRITAGGIAVLWLYALYHSFRRLPALIDDILERGLALNGDQANSWDDDLEHFQGKSNHRLPRPTTRYGRTLRVAGRGRGLVQRQPHQERL